MRIIEDGSLLTLHVALGRYGEVVRSPSRTTVRPTVVGSNGESLPPPVPSFASCTIPAVHEYSYHLSFRLPEFRSRRLDI